MPGFGLVHMGERMVVIVVFHVLMLLLALGIVSRFISPQAVSNILGYVHKTIGITTPSLEKVPAIALVWIGSTVIIVDGCVFLLVLITSLSPAGG
jgi:hypothetical protein